MTDLQMIKRHIDEHGFGSAIVNDHVAIGVVWTMRAMDGRERKREIIERVQSLEEACSAIGCGCADAAIPA